MTFPVSDIIRKNVLTAAKTRVDCQVGKPNFKGQFSSDNVFLAHNSSKVGTKLYLCFAFFFSRTALLSKFRSVFVCLLGQMKTSECHSAIEWPLESDRTS